MATSFLWTALLWLGAAAVITGICFAVWGLVRCHKRQKQRKNFQQEELERMKIDDL